ncbi:glucose-1-phosphate cytidylyltransferase [Lentimicrobium saccharophilum]|uniref:Glucose-1-phosphate cytidylyltransferase n=1 Tax=Lentimicrobium saccharophilum TaxID=1678841 RepID=A0A0S7BPC0_9BACT|nr:glucose-1-phosphate cytidylyltransferase [Lentimicrobium saccharophilum]GAP42346.1 glucose-1-phosphate cytidylyltransferase [Lentimicrobium saccharophilum]
MKVIILCGGMGTRLREETEYKPKPMVEIGGRPILWHIMKHYAHYGFNEFILALGYKGDVIRDYFLNYYKYNRDFTVDLSNGSVAIENEGSKNNWKVTLVETGDESMTGYRTKLAGKYVHEDRFMLTYGDAVATVDIKALVDFHIRKNTIGTVTGVYPPSRFGDLVIEGDQVTHFKQQLKDVENQSPINGGYFVFKREFLDLIPDDPGIDLEKLPIDSIVNKNQLSVFQHKGFWHSMDTFRDNQQLNKMWKENPVWKIWK